MSEWVGFSDADLEKMKRELEPQNHARVVKPVTGGRKKAAAPAGKVPKKTISRTANKQGQKSGGEVPAAALLSKPPPKPTEMKRKPSSPPGTLTDQIPLHGKTDSSVLAESKEDEHQNSQEDDSICKDPELVEDVEVIQKKEKLKLEDIQRRQKEMEEKNKRKKTMLTKAIAERKKRASAESNKLVKIQSELSKLDNMLNYDVSILRDKIDQACMDFNHAKKRFDKAEVEYIDAKMSLHKATEFKEDLTEHLYHLIQLNEERKAKKLEELMHKLELEEDSDEAETPETKEESTEENIKSETKTENTNASKSEEISQTDQLNKEDCSKETEKEDANNESKTDNSEKSPS